PSQPRGGAQGGRGVAAARRRGGVGPSAWRAAGHPRAGAHRRQAQAPGRRGPSCARPAGDQAVIDHLNDAVLKALPDQGPVVMLNLMRFRERSLDGNGSGWDAYLRYSALTIKLIRARGGTIIWTGNAEAVALGVPEQHRWDYVALVRYPSRAAFLDMMQSP